MGEEIDLFRAFISKRGLRNTPEREEIIREIFSCNDHFDVDELYLRMRNKGSRISKASIYRNIPLIMQCNLIREVWHEDGHMHYEPIYGQGHHCHLRCLKCGTVIEFYDEELGKVEKRLERKFDFEIIEHRLDVTGHCSECRDNRTRRGEHVSHDK
ncbi:MAG: transcriptional repressor [Deltaproteobacteria bacterium]|nr:transcriptional repressor [Deltaproteobacteria bacterium]MBW2136387.1 transcriptional repressor [Deltaproteobacteria bacterium]